MRTDDMSELFCTYRRTGDKAVRNEIVMHILFIYDAALYDLIKLNLLAFHISVDAEAHINKDDCEHDHAHIQVQWFPVSQNFAVFFLLFLVAHRSLPSSSAIIKG